MKNYNFPVYGTQGGGLAREVNGVFIFVEAPNCAGLGIGDEVPEHWDIQPANELARQEDDPDGMAAFDLLLEQDDADLSARMNMQSDDEVELYNAIYLALVDALQNEEVLNWEKVLSAIENDADRIAALTGYSVVQLHNWADMARQRDEPNLLPFVPDEQVQQ